IKTAVLNLLHFTFFKGTLSCLLNSGKAKNEHINLVKWIVLSVWLIHKYSSLHQHHLLGEGDIV
ncbi:MAG TPA: hypothetical protein DEO86_16335, partial [Colwellia sp.]|nr:hypothetical protein [Colwellia sp.]